MSRQVTCIKKGSPPYNDCACITHIGAWGDLGVIAREDAIRRIERGIDTFWVLDPETGVPAELQVAVKGSIKYLRTKDFDTVSDNLISLPEY